MTYGTLFGIGMGPGDPELITVKGQRILQRTPTVFVPVSEAGDVSVVQTIARDLLRADQRVVPLVFAMRRPREEQKAVWREHCGRIADTLAGGEDAAFLTEGDPLTYSTFAHLMGTMRQAYPEIATRAIPGVTSFAAAAAATDAPLVDGHERLVVLAGPYERASLAASLRTFENLVLLKVGNALDVVLDALADSARTGDATFIERCGWPDERAVAAVAGLRGHQAHYFSLFLVRRSRAGGSW